MISKWSDESEKEARVLFAETHGTDVADLVYVTRLLGNEEDLALHGGGNTSVKTPVKNIFGDAAVALFVKASGAAMNAIGPDGFVAIDAGYFNRCKTLPALSDTAMADEFRLHRARPSDGLPSIETLVHAFVAEKFVLHTHPRAVLTLSNRAGGISLLRQALGSAAVVVPYVKIGFDLAKAVTAAYEARRDANGVIIMHHGLITWADTAKKAYERTIAVVTAAEEFIAGKKSTRQLASARVSVDEAQKRYLAIAPAARSFFSGGAPDDRGTGVQRRVLQPLINEKILALLGSEKAREIALSPPLTPDYLIRTKTFPCWVDIPSFDDASAVRLRLSRAFSEYAEAYEAYVKRYSSVATPESYDALPRVLLVPGLGAMCAGNDISEARMVSDITRQGLEVKTSIYLSGGTYEGLPEEHLFDMEFRSFQRAKLATSSRQSLSGTIALVTGSAGAIGMGICQALLETGCHVAASDLPGENLDAAAHSLKAMYGNRVAGIALDVTDPSSVTAGFAAVVRTWGGIDCVIANAGIAHVSPIEEMDLDAFKKLERVNVEGTLLVLKEAGRLFKLQGMGGDIVLISTKNVFAPGAKFGAYSATKAAAHQLARIASLEMAESDVRVNMVAPDAVFSHGEKKSGLWAEVGPDRMRARGLDEAGLKEYYRNRNLLKASITAHHVANAVLFFVTRQTPTTGATIPVDGGLPDATPR